MPKSKSNSTPYSISAKYGGGSSAAGAGGEAGSGGGAPAQFPSPAGNSIAKKLSDVFDELVSLEDPAEIEIAVSNISQFAQAVFQVIAPASGMAQGQGPAPTGQPEPAPAAPMGAPPGPSPLG